MMLPRVDGEFLPDHPAVLLREGKYNKVDLISGITEHEGGISTRSRSLFCIYFFIILLRKAVCLYVRKRGGVSPLMDLFLRIYEGKYKRKYLQ